MWRRSLALLMVALAAGCGGGGASGPSASVTAPPRTTTTQARTPEQEVEAAYLRSWDVYAKAMRSLDGTRYPDVYAGEALALRRAEIASLKAANTPARMQVQHNYSVKVLRPDLAIVLDAYRNHSVRIDPSTGDPTEADPNNLLKREYELKKVEGTWKVVRVTSRS